MVIPPSALARNASGSNLGFDFFATTEIPVRARRKGCIIAKPASRRQARHIRAHDLIEKSSRFRFWHIALLNQ
jgi:hypothetical protein